jgi:hypothetical protein
VCYVNEKTGRPISTAQLWRTKQDRDEPHTWIPSSSGAWGQRHAGRVRRSSDGYCGYY